MLKFGGTILEASPRYQAAVKAQQAKERARAQMEKPRLVASSPAPDLPSPEELVNSVAAAHKMSLKEIWGPGKTHQLVMARRAIIVKLRNTFPHMSCAEIGKYIQRGKHMVTTQLNAAGVGANPRRMIDRAEVLRLISLDMTPAQIAEQLGFDVRTVLYASFAARNKVLRPDKQEMLDRAIKLRAKGYSYAKMAKILGVSVSVLQRDFVKMGVA